MDKLKKLKTGGLLSLRGFAKHRRVRPNAVSQAIKTGRITRRPDGKIDVAQADREWEQNTQPRPGNGHANGASDTTFTTERTRRESAAADLAEIALAEKRGELIRVEDAAAIWESSIARVRAKMMAAISHDAPKVVGLKTLAQAQAALEEIVYVALAAGAHAGGDAVVVS